MSYQTKLDWDTSFLMDISDIFFRMSGYCFDIFHIYKKYVTKEHHIWCATFRIKYIWWIRKRIQVNARQHCVLTYNVSHDVTCTRYAYKKLC